MRIFVSLNVVNTGYSSEYWLWPGKCYNIFSWKLFSYRFLVPWRGLRSLSKTLTLGWTEKGSPTTCVVGGGVAGSNFKEATFDSRKTKDSSDLTFLSGVEYLKPYKPSGPLKILITIQLILPLDLDIKFSFAWFSCCCNKL